MSSFHDSNRDRPSPTNVEQILVSLCQNSAQGDEQSSVSLHTRRKSSRRSRNKSSTSVQTPDQLLASVQTPDQILASVQTLSKPSVAIQTRDASCQTCNVISASYVKSKISHIFVDYHRLGFSCTMYGINAGGFLVVLMEDVDLVKLPNVCSFLQQKFECQCTSFYNAFCSESGAFEGRITREQAVKIFEEETCRIVAEQTVNFLLMD